VETILRFWDTCERDDKIAGFLGLDITMDGELIGTRFPGSITRAKYYDYYNKYGVKGDKKFVLRSGLSGRYPYPRFPGENYVGLNLKYLQLDRDYELLCLNEPLCIVEYLPEGSSRNMWRQYRRNPRGFLHYRFALMRLPFADLKFKLRQAAHVPVELLFLILKAIGL